ncbi:unnamed protein product [Peniophora sp. CBMAI 1063]|nr:unnamed protein product [Peniophora sp. CBMAI 1063]
MSALSVYTDSRLSLPPLDASADSPADSLDTPFPLTPADPFVPSWAPPRIVGSEVSIARIAKCNAHDPENDDWPSDVPLHMINVFRVFATRVDADEEPALDANLKRKAEEAFVDVEHPKKRRPDAEHAVPFPAVGPLPIFKHKFQLAILSNENAGSGLSGEDDASITRDACSAYTFESDSGSEIDESSSPCLTLSEADPSFEHYYPRLHARGDEVPTVVQPQLPVQQPLLYQYAPALAAPFMDAQAPSADTYPSYIGGYSSDVSSYAMPTPHRVAPTQPSFLGDIPTDVLSSSQPITRRSSEGDICAPVSGSAVYDARHSLAQHQQPQAAAYQHQHRYQPQPYVDHRQVYWTPPPQPAYHYAHYHHAMPHTGPVLLQHFAHEPLHGSHPDASAQSFSYSTATLLPTSHEAPAPLPTSHQTPLPATAASPPTIDYQRALIIMDDRVVYACHLCERTFDLPNGLGLHLRWHQRMDESERAERRVIEEQVRRAYQGAQGHQPGPYILSTANVSTYYDGSMAHVPHGQFSIHGWPAQPQLNAGSAAEGAYVASMQTHQFDHANTARGTAQAAYCEAQKPYDPAYHTLRNTHAAPLLSYGALAGAGWHSKRA